MSFVARRLWLVSVALLSCAGRLDHDALLEFGDVTRGQFVEKAFVVRNVGSAAMTVELRVDEAQFTLSTPSLTVPAGASSDVTVRFAPGVVGQVDGFLFVREGSNESTVALQGRGVAGVLSVPLERIDFGVVPFLMGGDARAVVKHLRVTNAGTADSVLSPAVSTVGVELCVGTHVESDCVPWEGASLRGGQSVDVPLSFLPRFAGARRWAVNVTDPSGQAPALVVDAVATVESFEACKLALPSVIWMIGGVGELTLRHDGARACRLEDVLIESEPADAFVFTPLPETPRTLTAGEPLTFELRRRFSAPLNSTGMVRVKAFGADDALIPLHLVEAPSSCLTLVPDPLDFGAVALGCASEIRAISAYNTCSVPVRVTRVSMHNPRFEFINVVPSSFEVLPGSAPFRFQVRFMPRTLNSEAGAMILESSDGTMSVVAFSGRGVPAESIDVTHVQTALWTTDVVLLVDPSASFAPRRPTVRTRLEALVRDLHRESCADPHFSVVPADGASDGGVQRVPSSSGATVFETRRDGGLEALLSALDALPVGSETESCIDPATQLYAGTDAGRPLSFMCFTDAPEHATNATQKLAALQSVATRVTWNVVGPFAPDTCSLESLDDGVHASLVMQTFGERASICSDTWWEPRGSFGARCELTKFGLPAVPRSELQVFIDGHPVLPADAQGNAVWYFDSTLNALVFIEPPPGGSRINVRAEQQCE